MVAEIISIVVDSVTGLLSGLGTGVVTLFNTLFLDSSGQITAMATWVIVLLGVAIGLGAMAWVSTLIRGKQR